MNALIRIAVVLAVLNCTLGAQTPAGPTDEQIAAQMDDYVQRLAGSGFSGVLLVARNDRVLFAKGAGFANRAMGAANTPDTVFPIGTLTMQFTAAAILKLQMQEKLKIGDTLAQHLAGVPEDKKSITLHQLLTHTAGFAGTLSENPLKLSIGEYVKQVMQKPLLFTPGERYSESGIGYSLLGIIVEMTAGKSYETFLNENLFQPAGMTATGYVLPPWKAEQLAHGYRGNTDWGTLRDRTWGTDGPGWQLRASGGILSTANDIFKWYRALMGNDILDEGARNALFTPYVDIRAAAPMNYGYGWSVALTPRRTRLAFDNSDNGIFTSDCKLFLDEGVAIIAFANTSVKPVSKITPTAAHIAFGQEYKPPLAEPERLDREKLKLSPPGAHALALVDGLGTSAAGKEDFVNAHFSPSYIRKMGERLPAFLRQDQGRLGRVKFLDALRSDEDSLEVTVRSQKTGRRWLWHIKCESEAPFRIDSLGLDLAD